jgi:hypothetical protein
MPPNAQCLRAVLDGGASSEVAAKQQPERVSRMDAEEICAVNDDALRNGFEGKRRVTVIARLCTGNALKLRSDRTL